MAEFTSDNDTPLSLDTGSSFQAAVRSLVKIRIVEQVKGQHRTHGVSVHNPAHLLSNDTLLIVEATVRAYVAW